MYTKHAQKDAQKLSVAGLKEKAPTLLMIVEKNPFQNPPPFEELVGDVAVSEKVKKLGCRVAPVQPLDGNFVGPVKNFV